MAKRMILTMAALVAAVLTYAQAIAGAWSGELKVNPTISLRVVFHFDDAVTMDSPDQGTFGIACEPVHLSADSVCVKVPGLAVTYSGRLKYGELDGTFQQGMLRMPLTLSPGEKRANRPQTPVPPYPYATEPVTVANGDVSLAGTLTVPENADGNTSVVVMVTGSGKQNRDEELFEHKPFAVIADYLARRGIATLRYDDRGFGESTGDATHATTVDFAADAEAAVNYIKQSRRFGKVGVLGHSEGGMVAYMLGARNGVVDFIVSIAGPSVPGTKTSGYQNQWLAAQQGVDQAVAADFGAAVERAFVHRLNHGAETSVSDSLIAEIYPAGSQSGITKVLSQTIRKILTDSTSSEWLDYYLGYDPETDMKALKVPAMIVYGEKDRQVPPELNVEPARRHAPSAKITVYPGLNHMMQHADTGSVDEYKAIEETFAPEVMADIVKFIQSIK